MKKKLLIGLLAVVMCFALTGCGEEKTNNGGSDNQGGNQQQEQGGNQEENNGVADNLAWPDNEFTQQITKPSVSFTEEAMSDSVTCYLHPSWTIEQAKSYAEVLVSNGYVLSSKYVDNAEDYMVVYKNADGTYQVTLAASQTKSDGQIIVAIPLDKR